MTDHPFTSLASAIASHATAGASIIAGFSGQTMPTIAAGVAAIWYSVQIWESRTAKLLLRRTTQEEENAKLLLKKAAKDAADLLAKSKS